MNLRQHDIAELNKKKLIVTTEKDFMRLQKYNSLDREIILFANYN